MLLRGLHDAATYERCNGFAPTVYGMHDAALAGQLIGFSCRFSYTFTC